MRNFNNPYFSRDIAEFWRRWHISLTSWFRDYVYIPLGGSRNGQWRTIANTFVVFLLCAIWHGANWTYMVWGLYNIALFVPLIMWKKRRVIKNAHPESIEELNVQECNQLQLLASELASSITANIPSHTTQNDSYDGCLRKHVICDNSEKSEKQFLRVLLTFVLVTIGWIIFRAPTVTDAWGYISTMCTNGWTIPFLTDYTLWVAIAMIGVMLGFEWHYRNTDSVPMPRNIWISYILLALICFFAGHHTTDFIYFQF